MNAATEEAPAPAVEEVQRRQTHIALVGCGFLGSLFAEELAKRFFAFEESLKLTCIDDDKVDERNPANHFFSKSAVGERKATYLAAHAHIAYGFDAVKVTKRVGPGDEDLFKSADIIVDAVDNLETRQWLWRLGVRGTPVLHLGVSQEGTGAVEWTVGNYDTFSLAPTQLGGFDREQIAKMTHVEKLPPCDLVGFRGLGLLTALAGARAVCQAYGMDAEQQFEPGKPYFTSWQITNAGYQLREKHDVGV